MMTFTDWDIVRNLLLAARWTILLSLTAFIGGTLVTLPLLLIRLTKRSWPTRAVRLHSAADFPSTRRGASMTFSSAVMCGNRLKFWNTMPTERLISRA